MNTSEKTILTASIYYIETYLKSTRLIHNSKVMHVTGGKMRRRRGRTQEIANHYAFSYKHKKAELKQW